jgi:hypothetical protein
MNVLDIGYSRYKIFKNQLNLLQNLPAQTYRIGYDEDEGLFLQLAPPIEKIRFKLYGNIEERADMVITSYKKIERNLGVIISGERGLGKTLCSQLICYKMLHKGKGVPIIVVDKYYDGINHFLASIDQDCVILFDEFEKNFKDHGSSSRGSRSRYDSTNSDQPEASQQEVLLGLFDGTDSQNSHKLFLLICNDINGLNQYYLGRPGRFHYHIRFTYPINSDVLAYLQENTDPKYYGTVTDIALMSEYIQLSYDSLRAIAFEINQGKNVQEIISNLNIQKGEDGYTNELYAIKIVANKKPIKEEFTDIEYFRTDWNFENAKIWISIGEYRGWIMFPRSAMTRKTDDYSIYEVDTSEIKMSEDFKDASITSATVYGSDAMYLMQLDNAGLLI